MVTLSELISSFIQEVEHTGTGGFDVEVKVRMGHDLEGGDVLALADDPTLKFSILKKGQTVVMQPYYYNEEEAD